MSLEIVVFMKLVLIFVSIFKTIGFQSKNFEGVIYRWGFSALYIN